MSAAGSSHWAKNTESQEEDRVETLIRKSGCWDQHLGVVECMTEKGDWRACQETLGNFRLCMTKDLKEKHEAASTDSQSKKN